MATAAKQPERAKASSDAESRPQADGEFLHRILLGLVTATVICGAVAVTLTAQELRPDLIEIASLWGPA